MPQRESVAWNSKVNQERIKINWQFTRKRARVKLGYKRSRKNRFTRSKHWQSAVKAYAFLRRPA
jgi:hypothetical protein